MNLVPDPDGLSGAGLALRLAEPADLPEIHQLNAAAYARYSDRMDRPPAPVTHDYAVEVGAGSVWLAGQPAVGVIVLIPAGDCLLIENVAVLPPAQGTGIGRQLMDFAEQRASALGLTALTLYTNEAMVENLAIYTRLGYRETARRTEHGYNRVYMEKRLPANISATSAGGVSGSRLLQPAPDP